jgi:hypothetical protein
MAKMNIVLPDELEEKFRKVVFERKGMKKGNISAALEEAIALWVQTTPETKSKPERRYPVRK